MISWARMRGLEADRPALILGNGTNRQDLPVSVIGRRLVVIGCNAAWSDTFLHYLVLGDKDVTTDLAESTWWLGTQIPPRVVVRHRHWWKPGWADRGLVCEPSTGQGAICSGVMAVDLALHLGCRPLLMAGFAFDAGNVYRGRKCYQAAPADVAVDAQADGVRAAVRDAEAAGVPVFVIDRPSRLAGWSGMSQTQQRALDGIL